MSSTVTGRAVGISPFIVVSSEELTSLKSHDITDVDIDGVKPPTLADGAAYSPAINMFIQPHSTFNFNKITEPKYDGIADKIGRVSNVPDFISDYHFIGIMRNVDEIISPEYRAHITVNAHSPSTIGPPKGS
jgi:hypothetical protein